MLLPKINIQIAMRKLFGIPYLIAAIAIFATIYGCEKEETNGGTQTVAVSGVSLSKTTLSLVEGGSETLTATVAPSNATNKAVSWKSSDAGTATVDSNGKVTAVKAGSATITVTTSDGGKTATCSVTVTAKEVVVEGLAIDPATLEI